MSQREEIYLNYIDPKKIQKYLEQNKESNSVSWRLIKIRDDKEGLLNKKYDVAKNERGDYPIGKKVHHNEEYDKEYEVIQNNFKEYSEQNNKEKEKYDKKTILSVYEFLLLDNIELVNPRFSNELSEKLKQDNYVDVIELKAKTKIDHLRIDLAESAYYQHEVTNDHVLGVINQEKNQLFSSAKSRAKKNFSISTFDIQFHVCVMKYKKEYINYLQDYFYNRKFK